MAEGSSFPGGHLQGPPATLGSRFRVLLGPPAGKKRRLGQVSDSSSSGSFST